MIPIIDTHQHLWDLQQFRLPWLAGGGPLAEDHLMDRYLAEAAGINLAGTIYMEVDVDPSQHVAEAEYVLDLCGRTDNPMLAATIGGRPADPGFPAYIERFASNPYINGVRQVLHGGIPPSEFLSSAFIEGVRLLGRLNLHFDLCLKPTEIYAGAEMADRCTNTRFVLDHCGNGEVQSNDRSQWQADIVEIAKRDNVICKISGIVAGANADCWTVDDLAPIVLHCAEVFGPDRIVFGSDWPVCTLRATYKQWVDALLAIIADWSAEDQRKLLHDNAVTFYGLHSRN